MAEQLERCPKCFQEAGVECSRILDNKDFTTIFYCCRTCKEIWQEEYVRDGEDLRKAK